MRQCKIISTTEPLQHEEKLRSFLNTVDVIINVSHFCFPIPVQTAIQSKALNVGFIYLSIVDYE